MKIAFILNGKIKHCQKIISQIKEIFSSGYDLSFYISQYAGHCIELASDALKSGATHIIAVGGDGTLNEVINGVMSARNESTSKDEWNRVRIGLLPKGSGNDFAKTMSVEYNLPMLKNLIEADSYKQIDLGLADYQGVDGKPSKRLLY